MSDGNRLPCPKCGALNYLADDICVSCGYDLPPVARPAPAARHEASKAQAGSGPSKRSQRGDGGEPELTASTDLDPRETEQTSDETGPGDTAEQPEPSEQSDDSPLPLSGCGGAGCYGAVVGFVLTAFLFIPVLGSRAGGIDLPVGGDVVIMACAVPGAVVGGLVGGALWAMWHSTRSAKRGGS